jgi:hypothetical protein
LRAKIKAHRFKARKNMAREASENWGAGNKSCEVSADELTGRLSLLASWTGLISVEIAAQMSAR